MKKTQTAIAIEHYEAACNDLVEKFAKKQGYTFESWMGGTGGMANFIDHYYYFNLSDIILDLKVKAKKGEIFKWTDENVKAENVEDGQAINYNSYLMGLRVKDVNFKPPM